MALQAAALPCAAQAPADGGSRSIDHWLVAAVAPPTPGVDPLAPDGLRLFPDRDVEVGPGTWALVREDGADRLALDRFVEPRAAGATATLAHAYVRPTADRTATLTVDAACAPTGVWLNGQELPDASAGLPVRLAGGWNTVLVALSGDEGCPPDLAVHLGPPSVPILDDEPPWDPASLRIQASRPPGARPTYPLGFLQPGTPTATHMTWDAESDRLLVDLEYSLTSWGAGLGAAPAGPDDDRTAARRPTGGPTVDLTGEWSLRFYTPSGIVNADAILEMSPDGELTGRIEGDVNSDIRDGWVSGEEFGWLMRFPDLRQDRDAEAHGVVEDGRMTGAFGLVIGSFETRFEGQRRGGGGERRPPGAAPGGRARPEGRPGGGGRGDITFPTGSGSVDRESILRRLRPPAAWVDAPAPRAGSIALSVRGRDLSGGVDGLRPGGSSTLTGSVEFDRVRDAALQPRSVEARVRWDGDEHRFRGQLDPADVLLAFHRPIPLTGWGGSGAAGLEGRFRVPDALAGFTLRVLDGTWFVGGSPIGDATLCSPCRRGERLDLRVTGTDRPSVQIADPGYPSAGPGAPAARAWLEALRGNNEAYRRLGAQGAGSSSSGDAASEGAASS